MRLLGASRFVSNSLAQSLHCFISICIFAFCHEMHAHCASPIAIAIDRQYLCAVNVASFDFERKENLKNRSCARLFVTETAIDNEKKNLVAGTENEYTCKKHCRPYRMHSHQ